MQFLLIRILFVFLLLCYGCRIQKPVSVVRDANWSQRVELPGLMNLYKVDNDLYRSEQPQKSQMLLLEKFGIKTVINLRNIRNDNYEAKHTALEIKHVAINTWTMSYEDILRSINVILKSPKPILIHCKHGSDRTGCIVAVYRMVKCNWTKEAAIREFKGGGYGYHEQWFPNILKLLNTLNVEQLKRDIALS